MRLPASLACYLVDSSGVLLSSQHTLADVLGPTALYHDFHCLPEANELPRACWGFFRYIYLYYL